MDGEKIRKPEATKYLFCNHIKQVKDGQVTIYTYDVNDRLTEETGTRTASYTYDKQGNTLTQTINGITSNYSYNAKHKLIQANDVSFNYDIDGVRSSKTKGNTTIDYTTDKNRDYAQVVLEKQNNQTVASYTYGDDLLSQTISTGTNFYGYDGLGSTKFLTNTQGQITDTYQYDAYGKVTTKTGMTDNNYLYTGEQYDRSLNQYYLRARYYNQGVGRFTQMDTWMGREYQPTTLNKYLYADGAPTMYVDPTGHFSLGGMMAAINVRATLSTIARAASIARRKKTMDLYNYTSWPLHVYMYAERKGAGTGTRYDVGNALGWDGVTKKNAFSVLRGGYVGAASVTKKSLQGKGVKTHSMTYIQYILWHATVVGSHQATCRVKLDYSLNPAKGTNCVSWTVWANAKAVAIKRLPI